MDTEMMTEKVLIKKEKLSSNIEQLIETDLSLADYYGDIVKILGCSARTNIFSCAITGDKAVVDGNVALKIMYIDSQGKTEIVDCSVPFNRSIDIKNASGNDNINIECISEQINCRAVNPRRAEVRGSVTLRIHVTGTEECSFVSDTPKGLCHTLKTSTEGNFLKAYAIKHFSLSAESENSENFRGAKIYRIYSIPTVNEIKTIKNKMMIKGNITSTVVLVSAKGTFEQERIIVPVNQIIEMDNIDEETICCVTLKTQSIDGRISPDTPQSPPHAELSLTVSADIHSFKKGTVNSIDEAYSSTHELICDSDTVKCISSLQRLNDNHTVTSKFDFSSCNMENIDDAAIKRIKYTVHKEAESVIIKGNIHYGIVASTKDNDKMYFERIADFEYKKQCTDENADTEAVPIIHLNAVNCSTEGNSTAIITAELHIDGYVYNCRNIKVLTCIEKGNEIKKDRTDTVFTVYFAGKGERLWDIAKAHCTSTENIKSMNELSGDTIENDCMLIFEQE